MVYAGMTALSMFWAYLATKSYMDKGNSNNFIAYVFVFLSCLTVVVVAAIRYNVGTDFLDQYYRGFIRLTLGGEYGWEPLFVLLCSLLSSISSDPQILIVATSIIIYGLLFVGRWRLIPEEFPLAVLFFLIGGQFFDSLVGLRQWIAVGMFLNALASLKEGRKYEYWIYAVLGYFFHKSAIVLVPVWFFLRSTKHNRDYYIRLVIALVFFVVLYYGYDYFMSMFGYDKYLEDTRDEITKVNNDASGTLTALIVAIFSLYVFKHTGGIKEKREEMFVGVQWLELLVYFSEFVFYSVINRFVLYFYIAQFIILPLALKRLPMREKTLSVMGFIVMWLVFDYIRFYIGGTCTVFPYQTIFSTSSFSYSF